MRITAWIVLFAMVFCLLAGCGSDTLSAAEAEALALSEMGRKASEVDEIHTHVITEDGKPCYQVHITIGESEYEYTITSDGDILYADILK